MKPGSPVGQGLTARQAELLAYLRSRSDTPSFEEMKVALGIKSKSGVHRLIDALAERGFIERLHYRARSIRVLENPTHGLAPLSQYPTVLLELELARRAKSQPLYSRPSA